MPATKQLALGSLVKVDHNADTVYNTIGLARTITPPGRSRVNVDGTILADTLKTYEPGVEDFSEFQFMQLWHPNDADPEILDTLFANKTKVNWQVLYGSSPVATDTFQGYVSNLAPESMEIDGVIARVVTVQRTGAITRS
jgi:hypothetical protein